MSLELILRRILRDPEDASGQTVRSWTLTAEGGQLTMTGGVYQDAYAPVVIRETDARLLIADIEALLSDGALGRQDAASMQFREGEAEAKGCPQNE